MKWLASLFGGVATGGLSLLGTILPGLATSIGDIWLKSKQTQAAREGAQDDHGTQLAGSWLDTVTEANRARAEQGAWGPLGLITIGIGLAFVVHGWAITLDSMPLFGHVIGSWKIAALPGKWADVELSCIQALFYTAPPAAAAVAIAKAFRR